MSRTSLRNMPKGPKPTKAPPGQAAPGKFPDGQRVARRAIFIARLARFLAENQAVKSMALEVETKRPPLVSPRWAREWADLRAASPLFGYPTVEEADAQLREFLL